MNPPVPVRVMVSRQYDAVSLDRARREYETEPDVIFVRRDAWTLGAPWSLAVRAFDCWASEWVEVWYRDSHRQWHRCEWSR